MRTLMLAGLMAATSLFAAQVPRPVGPLSFTLPSGQTANVADHKGKVLVVEILSTTCPHCQSSARTLSKIKRELNSQDFEVLGVAINDNPNIPEFVRNFNVNFPVGRGTRDAAYSFLQISVMAPFYFPQMVFVDRQGNVRGQYGGTDAFVQTNEEANVRGMVEKLLKEGKPAAAPKAARKKAS